MKITAKDYLLSLGLDEPVKLENGSENCYIALAINALSIANNCTYVRDKIERWRQASEAIEICINKFYSNTPIDQTKVDHPKHYNRGSIETIEFMASFSFEQLEGFCILSSIKYLSRYKDKGSEREDLNKAKWYIDYLLK